MLIPLLSALFLEHCDLQSLDAFSYVFFGVVVLTYDVRLDALRVLVEVDYVGEERALYYESACCSAPVETCNRDASLADLVDAVDIVNVQVAPAVCLYDNAVRTAALSDYCSST